MATPAPHPNLGPLEVVALYCACGYMFEGAIHRGVRARFVDAWNHVHSGPGHGETDARGAEMAALHQEALAWDRCRAVGGA